jgi:CheY-like chemotaxis protein
VREVHPGREGDLSTTPGEGQPMNTREPRVLAAGVERQAFERLVPVLQRDAVQVDWVASPEAGIALAAEQRYDVIILDAEPAESSLERVVGELRRGRSPSRNAAIMVLAEPDQVDAARALKSRGVNRVMLVSDPPQMVCEQMAGLLNVAPRVAARVPMNLMTALGNRGRELFCQTVNLSATGMLVRMEVQPQLGSPVVFRLHLAEPAGTVIGRGEMVRHASRSQGGFGGVGVRFVSFAEDGEARLHRFLESRSPASARRGAPTDVEAERGRGSEPLVELLPEFDALQDPDLASFFETDGTGEREPRH